MTKPEIWKVVLRRDEQITELCAANRLLTDIVKRLRRKVKRLEKRCK